MESASSSRSVVDDHASDLSNLSAVPSSRKSNDSVVSGVRWLAEALERVSRTLGTSAVTGRFTDTIPLEDGHLPLLRVHEAAAKLGLSARIVQKPLTLASPLAPPFIAFTKAGEAFVVREFDARTDRVRTIAFTEDGQVEHVNSLRDLSKRCHNGLVYLARRDAAVDTSIRQEKQSHWFWSAASRFKASYVQVLIAGFLVNLLALALPLFVMNVYDRVIPNLTIPTLWALAAGVMLAVIFDLLLKTIRAQVVDETGRRIDMAVSGRVFDHLLEIRSDMRPQTTGVLASHVRDFDNVRDVLTSSAVIAITDAIFIFVFLAALYWIVGPLAAIPAIVALFVLAFTFATQIPMATAIKRAQSDSSKRHGILVETLLSLDALKALGGGSTLRQRFDHSVAEASRSATAARFWSSLNTSVLQASSQITSVIIIVWGVFLVLDAQISVGALIAANILAGRVLAPLASVAGTIQRLQQAKYSYQAVSNVMDLPSEWTKSEATRPLKTPSLIVERLNFKYSPDGPNALQDISFELDAGARLGVIGRIGSGKSTFGRLLSGLSQPSSGRLLIDEVDIQQLPPTQLRRFVGYVPQEPELISGTLGENLTIGVPLATPDEIDQAIELAGLEDFARSHPLGLSMPIAERGRSLSGGQRHSVALAQALIRKPRLLFLDEPTAALDLSAERRLLERLRKLSEEDGTTIIVATHRHSTLTLVDKLLVLERGRLAAFGPKERVLTALEKQAIKNADNTIIGEQQGQF